MSRIAVNPTRMELRRLKDRLKTAQRGHKLLKDKSDEMVRRFLSFVRENKRLREEIESDLASAMKSFMLAKAVMGGEELKQTLCLPARAASVTTGVENVMGVEVPTVSVKASGDADALPYALTSASSDLDTAVRKINLLMEKLLKLAEVEKTCDMLADEIERNRRRVNALEYVMIPELNETIKYIMMKLDENERGSLVRLMKVKSMMEQQEQ